MKCENVRICECANGDVGKGMEKMLKFTQPYKNLK